MSEITCGPIIMGLDGKHEITLRDYFAAKAMQGICSTLNNEDEPYWLIIAEESYKMADAMLKEREIER